MIRPEEARDGGLSAARTFAQRWTGGHGLGDDPLVTILIDHSGSMAGPAAQAAWLAAKLLGDMFDRLGLRYEVLGYTTSAWRGGNAQRAWIAAGRPRFPGRLNDLLHIVYRDANGDSADWCDDLQTVLNGPLLKENIDGEALEWAERRARQTQFSTWVCLCLTDGAPVDDATILHNGGRRDNWYLADHLKAVIARLQCAADVRLCALGMNSGRWASHYYATTLEAEDFHAVPAAAFELLRKAIWREGHTETSPQ